MSHVQTAPVAAVETDSQRKNYTVPLATLIGLFFMWGFITCMNDILIPHFKSLFKLSYFKTMLIQFCFFGAYFIGSVIYFLVSYYKGDPINKMGYKNGLILGLIISAIGCLLFYPASHFIVYELFLLALFILGVGFTLLQIAANPYVAMLGSAATASSRLNLAQAFNSIGTTLAPVIGGYLIYEMFSFGSKENATQFPYLVFCGLFIGLAMLLRFVQLPTFKAEKVESGSLGALSYPNLRLGIFAIFFYVGAEVCIGSFMINFLSTDGDETIAKKFLALYWGGAMIGRFTGSIFLSQKLSAARKIGYAVATAFLLFLLLTSIVGLAPMQMAVFAGCIALSFVGYLFGRAKSAQTLMVFSFTNLLLVVIAILAPKEIATWAIVATGLFNSIMWSNIFTLAIDGLGKYVSQGSSLLIMGILGGALMPLLQGLFADKAGIKLSFILPACAYLYVLYYGYFCSTKLPVSSPKPEVVASLH